MRNPAPPMLLEGLAQALSRAERSLTAHVAAALQDEGCSVERWRILLLLADREGRPMSEVAECVQVPAPSLTRLVDRMATDGLVHRRVDERDRRRVLIHLTREGLALQRRAAERVERAERALLADVDPAELQRLRELLDGLAVRLH